MSEVRVRFAPSPTGHLHVGGARTALFNWLFARHHGGRFLLRIEDTDVSRNIAGAEQKLLQDLRWLGLDWDEGPDTGGDFGPYRQSERLERYRAVRQQLIEAGRAYYAFDTPEELHTLRQQAAARKETFRYPRPDPLPGAEQVRRAREDGRPLVVRFKTPCEAVSVRDEILGQVSFPAGQLDDFVIFKSNGWPTYHLAVVVDDAAMQISHVLRAQEHLMNTPKHVMLQRALGLASPLYAHLPLVFNTDGSKMSKRDKHKVVRLAVRERLRQGGWTTNDVARLAEADPAAVARWLERKADVELDPVQLERLADAAQLALPEIDVHDFRVSGYLPEALVNFLALIGWSPGDDREMLSLEEMVEAFSLDRINKTSGRFDREKLLAANTDWGARLPARRVLAAFRDYTAALPSPLAGLPDDVAARLLAACAGFRSFRDVERKALPLFRPDDELAYDPQAVRKILAAKDGRGYATLERLLPALEQQSDWSTAGLRASLESYCERHAVKLKDVAQPLRVAVSGGTISPAIFDTLALLGRDATLRRIRRCLAERSAAI